METSFFSQNELRKIPFASIGKNVFLSRKASIYAPENISIGNNVRLDDFCILSGNITIGNYIHIAAYTALYGGGEGIDIEDFAGISARTTIYAMSDDYSGASMTNPMVPEKYKTMTNAKVIIQKHVIIGSGCVVLPGVTLSEGSAFGAMTLINKSSETWTINAGIPFRKIKERSKNLLALEKKLTLSIIQNSND